MSLFTSYSIFDETQFSDIYSQVKDSGLKRSNALCFNEDVTILCLNNNFDEEQIKVSDLKVGMLVKTFKHGFRKIIDIKYGSFNNDINDWRHCMFKMSKNEHPHLTHDLILTGGHSILVDSLSDSEAKLNFERFNSYVPIIDNKTVLLSSVSNLFEPIDNDNLFNFFHFILDNDNDDNVRFGVWANNILVETPSKTEFYKHTL